MKTFIALVVSVVFSVLARGGEYEEVFQEGNIVKGIYPKCGHSIFGYAVDSGYQLHVFAVFPAEDFDGVEIEKIGVHLYDVETGKVLKTITKKYGWTLYGDRAIILKLWIDSVQLKNEGVTGYAIQSFFEGNFYKKRKPPLILEDQNLSAQ